MHPGRYCPVVNGQNNYLYYLKSDYAKTKLYKIWDSRFGGHDRWSASSESGRLT